MRGERPTELDDYNTGDVRKALGIVTGEPTELQKDQTLPRVGEILIAMVKARERARGGR